jgi:2-dehydro-3-deoxyphosphogluconate aldolase/(4S)-4-hydroxy-2-oxoglutarate aldolase
MNKSLSLFRKIKENKVIAILAPTKTSDCVKAYEILHPLGVTLEIVFRSEAAFSGIKTVLDKYPDALLLAGTVMTTKMAESAIREGVAGIVSADYIPEVVEVCVENDIMCVPGGLGDAGKQLVRKAELYGCEFMELKEKYPYQWVYKLFPTFTETNSFVEIAKAWKGPYKDLTIFYTGGVSLKNLEKIVRTDPDGIFCGSALAKEIENPKKMEEDAKKWLSIVKSVKS